LVGNGGGSTVSVTRVEYSEDMKVGFWIGVGRQAGWVVVVVVLYGKLSSLDPPDMRMTDICM